MNTIDTLIIDGEFDSYSGYSEACREFTHHLIKRNNDKKFVDRILLFNNRWDKSFGFESFHTKYNDTVVPLLKHHEIDKPIDINTTVILRWGIPTGFKDDIFQYNLKFNKAILYFVNESDVIPIRWAEEANKYDLILTSSEFSKKSIENGLKNIGGNNPPVKIIHHGIDTSIFRKLSNHKNNGFNFGFVGNFIERKAIPEMVMNFADAFNNVDDVTLHIKLYGINSAKDITTIKNHLTKILMYGNRIQAPKIIIYPSDFSTDDMVKFYNSIDCMIQVSRGEAFSLPVIEAMACGTPSIVLNKGGHREFANKQTSFLVKNSGTYYINNDKFLDIDTSDYIQVMKYIYTHADKLEAKSSFGLTKVQYFDWNDIVEDFINITFLSNN